MRNLGSRFNESNVLNVRGGDVDEKSFLLLVLYKALEVSHHSGLTPSEERVFDGFLSWYDEIDPDRPYHSKHPAYAYVNLNSGVNLLFLIYVPHEGCRGGNWGFIMNPNFISLASEKFD